MSSPRRWFGRIALVLVAVAVATGCGSSSAQGAPSQSTTTVGDPSAAPQFGPNFLSGDVAMASVRSGTRVGVVRLDEGGPDARTLVDLGQPVGSLESMVLEHSIALLARTCEVLHRADDEDLHDLCDRGGATWFVEVSKDGQRILRHERVPGGTGDGRLGSIGDGPAILQDGNTVMTRHSGRWITSIGPAQGLADGESCSTAMGLVAPSDASGTGVTHTTGTTLPVEAPAPSIATVVVLQPDASSWQSLQIPGAIGRVSQVTCAAKGFVVDVSGGGHSTVWFVGGSFAHPTFRSASFLGPSIVTAGPLGDGQLMTVSSVVDGKQTVALYDIEGTVRRSVTEPLADLTAEGTTSIPRDSYYVAVSDRVLRVDAKPDEAGHWARDVPA